ncbi:pentapeptide repeat-containing protein [Amycolatopsis sp. WAC 01375]|uniref:pentapeptide repeat-containing protein n=1 Tax=Amycolatopsis sp. WAC 01375 TaxID=2203194 RepID=UPI0013151267|nr:pentapeptide repeat-containing protein [Amycolatopsis sp. WAC 01375]
MTDDARPALSSPSVSAQGRQLRGLTLAAMWTTAVVIAVLTAGAVVALWWAATKGLNDADLVKARLDALKIGLSVGVGSGGVVALYLAWRRQYSTEATLAHQQSDAAATRAHQERVAEDARADAIERRITELYLKAVEQLGSDKAPVRLGGLYALERLAQDNETQRQTIVNVFCAYLRMPYDLPLEQDREEGAGAEQCEIYRGRTQEREVRLTAQRLLGDHLKPEHSATYWGPLDLDLTGAQLIDFTLNNTRIGTGAFRQATFTGKAVFYRAIFNGGALFDGAVFSGVTTFYKAIFSGGAQFDEAVFSGFTVFDETAFADNAWFRKSVFTENAVFNEAVFKRSAMFNEAIFTGGATFDEASFAGNAVFNDAAFTGTVRFNGTNFCDRSSFEQATLDGEILAPSFVASTLKDPDT